MPTLHWIGKEKVTNHHLDIPYHTLDLQYSFADGVEAPSPLERAGGEANLIIHADNLLALKSLLPQYEGRVKCIYIDPPYNTGNEGWVYNDNVSSPRFKKWLGQVVGKEGEDLTRHDKWLCMMYPRLKLLHKLLADDGAIFISIDENEVSSLRLIMDEIFGSSNFIEQLVWNKRVPKNDKYIGNIHEYILLFVKNHNLNHKFSQTKEGLEEINDLLVSLKKKNVPLKEAELKIRNLYKKNNYDRGITLYNTLDQDYRLWGKINVSWPNGQTFGPRYDILHPKTKKPCRVPERGWRWTQETFFSFLDYENVEELIDGSYRCGKIWFAKDENTQPSSIKYLDEVSDFLLRSIISTKSEGAVSLKELITERFDYPKPIDLVELLLASTNLTDGIILDSFAGSGTTAHAVLNLNKQDGGDRKFILIEMEDYAETITAERVKRVINGYSNTEGICGSFNFYTLGERVLDDEQNLNPNLAIHKIHGYIWYSETHTAYTQQATAAGYLGKYNNTGVYFHYQPHQVTVLDDAYLTNVTELCEQYIMYADICLLPETLMHKHNIIFKKIPRDISKL